MEYKDVIEAFLTRSRIEGKVSVLDYEGSYTDLMYDGYIIARFYYKDSSITLQVYKYSDKSIEILNYIPNVHIERKHDRFTLNENLWDGHFNVVYNPLKGTIYKKLESLKGFYGMLPSLVKERILRGL